jgi:nicotinamide phosphoribosyltransferase
MTDSYKPSHFLQYPPGTEAVFDYIEARGGRFKEVCFFAGFQKLLAEVLAKPITKKDIQEAKQVLEAHGVPFNEEGWNYILTAHGGKLPLEIKAVPEGTVVPLRNALVTVTNTDPQCFWLPGYYETVLLRAAWYGTTVATYSRECRKIIKHYLDKTADSSEGLNFKLHDFGARGVSSAESASIGGLAHLVAGWQGSDTLEGVMAARRYYNEPMAAFSIPAAEHSTITSWGRDGEKAAYENMLDQFSEGLVAVVSDSYDLWNAIDNIWGDELKEKIENREGTLVVRPDSGDPAFIVSQTIEKLMNKFGYETNSKGYKVLPDCVRVIQGDGIDINTLDEILRTLEFKRLSADNLAFGMGGKLLQGHTRDDLSFAMKASAAYINGEVVEVFKDPITDKGKASKKGVLALRKTEEGSFETVRVDNWEGELFVNELVPVFRDGEVLVNDSLADIRARAEV